MKNKIIIYMACLAGLILASSCSTHDTVLKRRYMKGYYVSKHDRTHGVPNSSATPQLKDEHEVATVLSAALEPEKMSEPVLAQRTSREVVPTRLSKTSTQASEPVRITKRIQKPSVRFDQMLGLKKAPVRDDSSGLSLFWVVILVILILWAIGFLAGGFGIGNLINLLLVVALVLLILWLLRII